MEVNPTAAEVVASCKRAIILKKMKFECDIIVPDHDIAQAELDHFILKLLFFILNFIVFINIFIHLSQ